MTGKGGGEGGGDGGGEGERAFEAGHVREGEHEVLLVVEQIAHSNDLVGGDVRKLADSAPAHVGKAIATDGELRLLKLRAPEGG